MSAHSWAGQPGTTIRIELPCARADFDDPGAEESALSAVPDPEEVAPEESQLA